jgi:hypothetical protein
MGKFGGLSPSGMLSDGLAGKVSLAALKDKMSLASLFGMLPSPGGFAPCVACGDTDDGRKKCEPPTHPYARTIQTHFDQTLTTDPLFRCIFKFDLPCGGFPFVVGKPPADNQQARKYPGF